MIIALSILLTVCICFIVGLSIYILKNRNNKTNVNDTANKEILDKLEKLSQIDKIADKINEINDNHKAVNDKTVAMNQQINNVFKDTQEFVKIKAVLDNNVEEIKTRLSSIPQIHENITSIAKLYDNSKNRGNIGELHLESMLIDTFGENMIERQAPLNGGIIDYKVNTEKPIYIDSKFNKDNWLLVAEGDESKKNTFKKDVEKMIDDLTKYGENVIMFIPSERIFIDILSWFPDLYTKALNKGIFLAGPTTLYTQMFLISESNKSRQLEKNLIKLSEEVKKLINKNIPTWSGDWQKFVNTWNKQTEWIKKLDNDTRRIVNNTITLKNSAEEKKLLETVNDELANINNSLTKIGDDENNSDDI